MTVSGDPGASVTVSDAPVSKFVSGVVTSSIVSAGSVPGVNFAPTFFSTSIVRMHVEEEPKQPPPQPRNDSPAAGCAVSATRTPESNDSEHCDGEPMPAGLAVT